MRIASPNTKPYERWLLKFLVNSTVVDVAQKLDISEGKVAGVLDRWVATKVNWDKFKRIEILGIDEIALKRGHRDYVVLVTTPSTTQETCPKICIQVCGVEVLAVLPDRKKETVVKFFASIPVHLRNTIERVCTDIFLYALDFVVKKEYEWLRKSLLQRRGMSKRRRINWQERE